MKGVGQQSTVSMSPLFERRTASSPEATRSSLNIAPICNKLLLHQVCTVGQVRKMASVSHCTRGKRLYNKGS